MRSLCVNVLFSSVIIFFSFSGLLFFFSFFLHNFHRLLQCCALVIRMCTICITRFLICVYSLASQGLTITILVSQSLLDSRISDQDINITNYCISRKDSLVIHLLLDRLVLQYTYTTPLLTLHTGVKTLKVTLLNAFGLNQVRALLIFLCVFYTENLLMNGLTTLYKW